MAPWGALHTCMPPQPLGLSSISSTSEPSPHAPRVPPGGQSPVWRCQRQRHVLWCLFLLGLYEIWAQSLQSCPILRDLVDCSLLGSAPLYITLRSKVPLRSRDQNRWRIKTQRVTSSWGWQASAKPKSGRFLWGGIRSVKTTSLRLPSVPMVINHLVRHIIANMIASHIPEGCDLLRWIILEIVFQF